MKLMKFEHIAMKYEDKETWKKFLILLTSWSDLDLEAGILDPKLWKILKIFKNLQKYYER